MKGDFDFSYAQVGHGGYEVEKSGKESGKAAVLKKGVIDDFGNTRSKIKVEQNDLQQFDIGIGQLLASSQAGNGGTVLMDQPTSATINDVPANIVVMDFPVMGEGTHFKKLKSGARLDLVVAKSLESGKGRAWIWFLLGLVAIWALSRLTNRNQA